IWIQTITGKRRPVILSESSSVSDLARMVQKPEGIQPEQQRLFYRERELRFEYTLSTYGIHDGSTILIHLLLATSPLMAICVKTIAGKQIPLSLPQSALVADLAALVQESEGHPPEEQHLIYGGRWLAFEDRLSSYDIRDGTTIHLLIRGKGRA
ncbi:uncharacterized protein BT62DRAFT_901793, partial [Guyanagaster necrorhizus]